MKNYQAMIMTLCVDLAINTYQKKKEKMGIRKMMKTENDKNKFMNNLIKFYMMDNSLPAYEH